MAYLEHFNMYKNFINHLIKKSDLEKAEYFKYNKNKTAPSKKSPKYEYEKIQLPNFSSYIVLDFETTGLSPLESKILEIGAIKVKEGKIIGKFETLINPNIPIPPFISSKINITNDMVKDMPKLEDIFNNFILFLESLPLVIHNAKFDMSFLIQNSKNFNIDIKNKAFDTLSSAKSLFPELKKYNLAFLCKHFNIQNENAHRAMSDVMATYSLYQILYKEFKVKNNS